MRLADLPAGRERPYGSPRPVAREQSESAISNAFKRVASTRGGGAAPRASRWLVEATRGTGGLLETVSLSCISDEAQGEQLEVLWDAEIAPQILDDNSWSRVGQGAPDDPEVLAAHLRTVRWTSATAAERDLFQAPFRAGILLDPYQLLPRRKALRLPRVNL